MDLTDFFFEEHRALRAEIIQSMDDGNQILAFGLAAVGLVLGAGLSTAGTLVGFLVLGFFLPVLSGLVLSLWFAAQERIARASYYLSGLEARIKSQLDASQEISWEAWLRGNDSSTASGHFWSTEQSGLGLFALIILCSLGMAAVSGVGQVSGKTKALVLFMSLAVCAALFSHVCRRYRRWKWWLSTSYTAKT